MSKFNDAIIKLLIDQNKEYYEKYKELYEKYIDKKLKYNNVTTSLESYLEILATEFLLLANNGIFLKAHGAQGEIVENHNKNIKEAIDLINLEIKENQLIIVEEKPKLIIH